MQDSTIQLLQYTVEFQSGMCSGKRSDHDLGHSISFHELVDIVKMNFNQIMVDKVRVCVKLGAVQIFLKHTEKLVNTHLLRNTL